MLLNCGIREDSWESLGRQGDQTSNRQGNKSWIFIGRTDVEAETPILWPPDAKNWLIRKDPDAGKDWRQEENWTTEDEMVDWHHWLNGHEFEQASEVGDRQGSLVYCSPWYHKSWIRRSDWTQLIVFMSCGNCSSSDWNCRTWNTRITCLWLSTVQSKVHMLHLLGHLYLHS